MYHFPDAGKTNPKQTQPVVSLSNLFPSKKRAFLQISYHFLRIFALPILTHAHLRAQKPSWQAKNKHHPPKYPPEKRNFT